MLLVIWIVLHNFFRGKKIKKQQNKQLAHTKDNEYTGTLKWDKYFALKGDSIAMKP